MNCQSYQGMLSIIPKGNILTAKDKGLWELGIHDSGDQISALGDISFQGWFLNKGSRKTGIFLSIHKEGKLQSGWTNALCTCMNTDTSLMTTYSKPSIQTPGHTNLQAAWL